MLTVEIREEDCVGCSRCIQVCPVDAIVGANKLMHTILTDECIGCKLCLKPCPTDCIEVLPLENKIIKDKTANINNHLEPVIKIPLSKIERAQKAKYRFKNRTERLKKEALTALPDYSNDKDKKVKIKRNLSDILNRKGIKT